MLLGRREGVKGRTGICDPAKKGIGTLVGIPPGLVKDRPTATKICRKIENTYGWSSTGPAFRFQNQFKLLISEWQPNGGGNCAV